MDPEIEFSERKIYLPVVMARNERIVRHGFWKKLRAVAAKVPFAEDLGAAYFCVRDPSTPTAVKALLLAALAYFVLPFDFIPALFVALGLVSDAAVVVGVVRMVGRHIKPEHYEKAREVLGIRLAA
ncbi:MAG TPA: YkvA family protein [Rhizomicrobium sp.]|jgi:uncharacterized membrane protein YkvA (DUF1232 family)